MTALAARAIGYAKRVIAPYYVRYLVHRHRDAMPYRSPEGAELDEIDAAFRERGIALRAWRLDPQALGRFKALHPFPHDYHGGIGSRVWDEKLLEHFVAWSVLDLGRPGVRYVDVAGASSPWATLLRARGAEAYCVDLRVHAAYRGLDYYLECDATRLPWPDASIDAMSLQCAYEMFLGDSDTRFVKEAARVLRPGGKVAVVPLYMHTHPCYYSTPEHYAKDCGDPGATKYLRKDAWGVPASRKYTAGTLAERVLAPAAAAGLDAEVSVLQNPAEGGAGIYLRYFLTLTRRA